MNRLPEHRRVLHGRTFAESWDPAAYDPIRVYRSGEWSSRLIAVFIGVSLALVVINWIDWSLT